MARNVFGRLKEGVQLSGVNLNVHQKGKVFYVCNSTVSPPNGSVGSDSYKGTSADRPCATMKQVVSNAVASRGDVVVILPGHAETVADATTFAINKAGLRIIGTGDGALKPTFTLSAATSNIPMSAANCSLSGVRVIASAAAVTAGVTVSAANCEIDIETAETDSTHGFAIGVQTTAAASNLRAKVYHRGVSGSTVCTAFMNLVGVASAFVDIDFYGAASTAVVNMATTACTDIRVTGRITNTLVGLTKNMVDTVTGSTWSINGFDGNTAQEFAGSNAQALGYLTVLPTSSSGTGVSLALVSGIKALPQTVVSPGTTAITVVGGPIRIDYLALEITTVVQTQACNLSFATTDTVTSTTTAITGTVNISAGAAGGFITVQPVALSTAPVLSGAGVPVIYPAAQTSTTTFTIGGQGIVVAAGTVGIITSASNTGNYKLHLRYTPMAPGVTVTLA